MSAESTELAVSGKFALGVGGGGSGNMKNFVLLFLLAMPCDLHGSTPSGQPGPCSAYVEICALTNDLLGHELLR